MSIYKLPGSAIQSNTITTTQLITTVVTQISAGGGPRVSSLIYPGNDTAGNTVGGQTVYINGSGFEPNNAIYINGNTVPSKSFISASNLSFTTPALSAGIYPVYLINTDSGATAIFIPGYISSADPSWVTSASIDIGTGSATWNINLSATGDDPVTYALAGGSSLPSGISLAANGLISGTMSSPPENDTQYLFTVVASDAQNQDASRQFTVTVSVGEGVLFANNVLLIHADGTNNQNNHHFLDSSNNNFTITRNGNATQGSFSPFSQTGWSGYFSANGNYLTGSNTAFNISNQTLAWTFECWLFPITNSSFFAIGSGSAYGNSFFIDYGQGTANKFRFGQGNGSSANPVSFTSANTYSANQWHHVAVTNDTNGVRRMFINGVQDGTQTYTSASLDSGTTFIINGVYDNNGLGSSGGSFYGSNYRFIRGSTLYTTNFTPSTTPLTNIANTSLLTLQSNRFIDNSNNNFTITRNGGVSIQAFSPFAPTAAYTTANVGGSGYFDGTGDYLTVPASSAFAPGTSNFTIEAWVYPTTNSIDQYIWTQTVSGTNYFILGIGSTAFLTMTSSGGGTGILGPASSIIPFAWNHVAAVRSGGTVTVYVNGVAGTPGANALDLTNTSYVPTIGTYTHNTSASPLTGYLASLRYVKGTAVYTSAFTPPTAPLTNIANTSALLNFTNAGIFDQTAKTVLETVGDAKVSTAQYKYGTGSIVFDGTGDYLKTTPNTAILTFGTGDLTLECWIYQTATSTSTYRVIFGDNVYGSAGGYTLYSYNNALNLWKGSGGGGAEVIAPAGTITLNTWTHVAWTRSGSSNRLFINGTQVGNTTTDATNYTSTASFIGASQTGTFPFAGYIDDLRITKGYARYTSTFTAPTSALKDK